MNTSTPKLLSIFQLEAKTDILKTFRTAGFVLPSLLFPVMFYTFFGILYAPQDNATVSQYLLATYGVFGVMGPALFSFGADVAVEKDRGMLALKQISPMPITAYFSAKVMTAMAFAGIIIVLLYLVAALAGNVTMPAWQWLSTALLLLTGVLPYCAIGLFIGLKVKAQAAAAVVNLIYLPMSFLSGLWIPVMQFSAPLQKFAMLLPPFHFSQLVLKVQGADIGIAWWIHVIVLLAYTGLFAWLAQRAFKAMETR
ncbi:ABC transporter permease [Planctobacterium marinum]|uniref:ABC transporter permease n=1 Tax=Planctobacterium marinum TaxID=1631968 RepID=UPI001E53581D|nr:ABC transporter permease [Planctobacterium marinum]MCC2605451.1 ABC transporter permease [Planctobacterium marinum]